MNVTIVYDGEYPACSRLSAASRLREPAVAMHLIDARAEPVTDVQGLDLSSVDFDRGFAVIADCDVHLEAEGGHVPAALIQPSGLFFRIFMWLMATERRRRFRYPILCGGPNFLLRLLRVPKIYDEG